MKGIKQASPFVQTSCLEGFESLLNHFAPKMIGYSYVGMYCRSVITCMLTPDNFVYYYYYLLICIFMLFKSLVLGISILAAVHFNFHLQREVKCKEDGSERVRVSYPKFKNGEATVQEVKTKANVGKCSYTSIWRDFSIPIFGSQYLKQDLVNLLMENLITCHFFKSNKMWCLKLIIFFF